MSLVGLDAKRDELDAEIAHHLELLAAEYEAEGMAPEEARRAARKRFGGVEHLKEDCRDNWGVLWVEATLRDLRFAMRQMTKLPGFTALIILTLALGIGTSTTIFSVAQSTVLAPLPISDQDRVFILWENHHERGIRQFSVSVPNFEDFRERAETVDGLVALRGFSATLLDGDTPERFEGTEISAGAMALLGWKPVVGREFLPDEDQHGAAKVAMISEVLWRERYGADASIVGRLIEINREEHEIVGVFGKDTFVLNTEVHIWRPMAADLKSENRSNHMLTVCGRLKKGVSLEQSQAEMEGIAASLEEAYPDSNEGWGVTLEPIYEAFVPADLRRGMLVLFSAVGMLLLIACANVANLLLSRGSVRAKEVAVRVALGAGRPRVIRHMMTESAVYCFLGTLVGLVFTIWGVALVRGFAPSNLPRVSEISIDARTFVFSAVACMATIVLSGLFPALRLSESEPARSLGGAAKSTGGAPSKGRIRSGLVVLQLALSLSLVAGAGLLIKSFKRLQEVDPGFNASGVHTFRVTPDRGRYGDAESRSLFYQNMIDRIEALPGVSMAGMTSSVPYGPGTTSLNVFSADPSALEPEDSVQADWRIVSPKYFDTMEIPLIEGRVFTRFDTNRGEPVMLISKELADRFWPGESALGKRLKPGGGDNWNRVVGVVGDARIRSLSEDPSPAMFFSSWQWWGWDTMSFVIRGNGEPETMVLEIRSIVQEIDPSQPVFDFQTLDQYVSTQIQSPRLNSWLLGIFAAMALSLAVIGVYGVVASAVSQRTSEIGLRMALGARRGQVSAMILKEGGWLLAFGIGIGSLLSWQFARLMQSQLFEVSPSDLSTNLFAVIVLGLAGLLATVLPVMRASRIEPMAALRVE
ncbi:efflux ABC transporter, permease protein [Verrucomicrobiia bacterium DG1235]|nr:efflux ABC transporter, permease protein [Verrucomicrobiae bacterium DG1235]